MIIRSQDKKMIINMDNLDTVCIESKNAINAYSGDTSTRSTIAIYSTEEKAIKVLDMIQDAYEEANSVCTMPGFVANTVFKMPQDSEV